MSRPTLIQPEEPAPRAPQAGGGFALLRLGFRPFYLLGALAAAVLPLAWLALLSGSPIAPALPGELWHGHEMVFGFAVAVIVGFLLTAGRVWTGLDTPTGAFLAALALLWLAARIAGLAAPYAWFMLVDLAFLPLVAAVFADLVIRSRNVRNAPMAALLALLAVTNALFHLAHLKVVALEPDDVLRGALALIVAIESIVAGRVIPAFIGNAVHGSQPRVIAPLERVVLPASALAFGLWLVWPERAITALTLALLAALHAWRLWAWQPWAAHGRPILWILPAAYAWIPIGLALLAVASLGHASLSAGLHALTAGSMGGLIAAMMSRTSRGHTGRPMVAGRAERCVYALVLAGAALRVAVALLPQLPAAALLASGLLWCGAFALLFLTLAPWLLRPRLDGKPG